MSDIKSETAHHLTQWHQGDQEGLNLLLKRHLPWIRKHVQKRLGPKLRGMFESGDIVQEAVIQFLKYGPKILISDDQQFRAFLACIIENVLRDKNDWYTAKRREIARQHPLPSDTVLQLDSNYHSDKTPSKYVERHEREAWLRLGMELLTPKDREILILRQWNSMPYDKIGDRLDISANTARMRNDRAIGRLAKIVWDLRCGMLSESAKCI